MHELGVYADGTGNNFHFILSERASLIRANNGGVRHRLARPEYAHEEFFLCHAFGRERECERDGQW